MKILVYGAGVIGCELAHELCKGKNDVTILARGNWKQNIQKKRSSCTTLWSAAYNKRLC